MNGLLRRERNKVNNEHVMDGFRMVFTQKNVVFQPR